MLNREAIRAAYNYAVLTRGDLYGDITDPNRWMDRFEATVESDFESIRPFLLPRDFIADIGCGVGAVDVLAMQRISCRAMLCDGDAQLPIVNEQDEPFMSRRVVESFIAANGCHARQWLYCNVEQFQQIDKVPFDVCISLRSWCFHYPPSFYLETVARCTPRALIVDVRRERPEWHAELEQQFDHVAIVAQGKKWDRHVYTRKQT